MLKLKLPGRLSQPGQSVSQWLTGELLPGAAVTLLGLALAAATLGLGQYAANQRAQQQLIQAWGDSQAAGLRQSVEQLNADTQAAARNPALVQALLSQNPQQLEAAIQALRYWDAVVDVQLNLSDQAVPDTQRRAPMNYAALDLLRRLENGLNASAEAYRIADRWLIYSVAAIRQDDSQPVLGSLLLVFDIKRLLAGIPAIAPTAGQVQLLQRFARSTEAQILAQRGQNSGTAVVYASGNPNWTLAFTPAAKLSNSLSWPVILLALLLALGGALIGLYLPKRTLQRRLDSDASQLQQLLSELSAGKIIKPFGLHLPSLGLLAQNLSHLSQQRHKPESKPATQALAGLVDVQVHDSTTLDISFFHDEQSPPEPPQSTAMNNQQPPKLPADIFRAYDIRGVVDLDLTPQAAYWIGRAIGSQSLAQGEAQVAVGRDGRLSGPTLVQHLITGLVDAGCQVSDLGLVPTPVTYYAAQVLQGRSAVMLTGSHNPPDYNGFKIVIAGDTLANEQIQSLRARIDNNDLYSGVGSVTSVELLPRYLRQISDDIALARPLKVVVDCGNGAAGIIAPQLLEALGCSVIPLYCEVDGNFPNHHPDPGKPENLTDLIAKVKEQQADLGLAFDGDGDRLGVVTNSGAIIFPDRLLMLFAKDIVSRNPGADIIFDVKCSRRLTPLISGYGGRPLMWKTGHSLIKKKMKETGALLAGEMSGHIFFKERWFGFDDGIYTAARLLEIVSQDPRDLDHIFGAFPDDVSTPEINIRVTEQSKFAIIEHLQNKGQWGEARVTTLDGIRVDYPNGWGLVRASNTTPMLVLRFEAQDQAELERIMELFRAQLRLADATLKLPF
jgi:phosphomannomutase/phosphoglucomutase